MRKMPLYSIFFCLLCFARCLPCGAQEKGDELISVIVTGMGTDSDSALKNAFRAAIEQAVGTMVDAETLAQNDDIISDQILSYSQGYIESHKVLGEPKNQGGLVSIKIQAQVKRTPLAEKLKTVSISTEEVEGGNLFAKAVSKIEQRKSAQEMLLKAFEGFPENLLTLKLGAEPEFNERTNELTIVTHEGIDAVAYDQFVARLNEVLQRVALQHVQKSLMFGSFSSDNSATVRSVNYDLWTFDHHETFQILVCSHVDDETQYGIFDIYSVEPEPLLAVAKLLHEKHFYTINLVDKDKKPIATQRIKMSYPYDKDLRGDNKYVFILPLNAGDISSGPYSYYHGYQKKNAKINWQTKFKVSLDELKRMKNIEYKIEKKN